MRQRAVLLFSLFHAVCFFSPAMAEAAGSYPVMAPLADYLMPDQTSEIALARSAAAASVAADAEILVLGPKGYVIAVAGKNGFTCLVERAWFSGLEDDGFWNPKVRGPDCYNRQAAASVLPVLLTRTKWVLAGAPRDELVRRTRAAVDSGEIPPPAIGSMNFMLSKQGYLGDGPHGPWHPHVMFYMPPIPTSDWGEGQPGSPLFGVSAYPYTMFFVPVAKWSDGSRDEEMVARHVM